MWSVNIGKRMAPAPNCKRKRVWDFLTRLCDPHWLLEVLYQDCKTPFQQLMIKQKFSIFCFTLCPLKPPWWFFDKSSVYSSRLPGSDMGCDTGFYAHCHCEGQRIGHSKPPLCRAILVGNYHPRDPFATVRNSSSSSDMISACLGRDPIPDGWMRFISESNVDCIFANSGSLKKSTCMPCQRMTHYPCDDVVQGIGRLFIAILLSCSHYEPSKGGRPAQQHSSSLEVE